MTHELRKNPRVTEILNKSKPAVSVPKAPAGQIRDHDRKLPTKDVLCIPRFKWKPDCEKNYKNLIFAELPDGRVMLRCWSARVFTTKEKIMSIPYPIPTGYLKNLDMSSSYITAIRHYRAYLAQHSVQPGSGYLNSRENRITPVCFCPSWQDLPEGYRGQKTIDIGSFEIAFVCNLYI